jgi:carbon-monoxide dehydrogenase large subunit
VQYEALPVYIDALEAMKPGATLIHERNGEYWHLPAIHPVKGTNIAGHYILKKGDFQKALAEADYVIEGEFDYPFGSSAAIETHGAIVWFQNDGKIDCWSSSICPFIIREDLANTYGVPISDVRVRIPEIGGCFGYKSDITIEQTVAWIASHAKGRPVKWIASRKSDFERHKDENEDSCTQGWKVSWHADFLLSFDRSICGYRHKRITCRNS